MTQRWPNPNKRLIDLSDEKLRRLRALDGLLAGILVGWVVVGCVAVLLVVAYMVRGWLWA